MARAIEIHMHVRERGRNEGPCGECTRCEPIQGRQTKNQRERGVQRKRKSERGGRGAYAGGGTREAMGGGGGSSPVSMPMPRLSME